MRLQRVSLWLFCALLLEIVTAYASPESDTPNAHAQFQRAFTRGFVAILMTELGDRTFFIAVIAALKGDRLRVFGAAVGALALMTVLSAALAIDSPPPLLLLWGICFCLPIGVTLPMLLPRSVTHWVSTLLFFYFGFVLLKTGYMTQSNAANLGEMEEVEEEFEQQKKDKSDETIEDGGQRAEVGAGWQRRVTTYLYRFVSPVVLQVFAMTFLAEWGDRSQIITISLASTYDWIGVTIGGVIGHVCCTGLAVIGGKICAEYLSERFISLLGGSVFVIFGFWNLYTGSGHPSLTGYTASASDHPEAGMDTFTSAVGAQ